MKKTDQDWKTGLSKEQYQVTRCGGTEQPFSGKYYHHDEQGSYNCACCKEPLFSSSAKFESGSGWPSYSSPSNEKAVTINRDSSHGMTREEVICANCHAHLGHVFPDGPPPTGLRYCINSLSLDFEKTS